MQKGKTQFNEIKKIIVFEKQKSQEIINYSAIIELRKVWKKKRKNKWTWKNIVID